MSTVHPDRPQEVPLYYAILCGFYWLVMRLLDTYPENVDSRGGHLGTPLFASFIEKDFNNAQLLLERGADANTVNYEGTSVLHHASRSGDIRFM